MNKLLDAIAIVITGIITLFLLAILSNRIGVDFVAALIMIAIIAWAVSRCIQVIVKIVIKRKGYK